MDHHNRWTELQQHTVYSSAYPPPSSSSSYTHYPYQYLPHQTETPNPNFSDHQTLTGHNRTTEEASLWQPLNGESYSTMLYPSHVGADAQSALGYAHHQQNPDSLGVTQCSVKQAVQHQYVAGPVRYSNVQTETLTRLEPLPIPLPLQLPVMSIAGTKRKFPKKAKIVQSAWCEICKIDCNSSDVLNKHRQGKKHKKNLENLTGKTINAPVPIVKKEKKQPPQPQPQPQAQQAAPKDLETKKRKIVEGGAAVEALRVCDMCNVACNSETVFQFHLSGKKHAAMVKQFTTGNIRV